jgi:hypothetical protein
VRIIKQSEFVKLPPGVFYMHYKPCVMGELRIKGETCNDRDWMYASTDSIDFEDTGQMVDRLEEMEHSGASYPLDVHTLGRNGMFDPDESLIAILEPADCVALAARLLQACYVDTSA